MTKRIIAVGRANRDGVTIKAAMTPAQLGAYDYHNGLPCDPTAHFGHGNDYDQRHISGLRGDYLAAYVKAKHKANTPAAAIDYQAEAEEYENDIEEREWNRRGC